MESMRKPFQGVLNIIRFNWHFYLLAASALLLLLALVPYLPGQFSPVLSLVFLVVLLSMGISLLVSFYVYDLSRLYKMDWLQEIKPITTGTILNIHAGFDETSALLQHKFSESELLRFDFYDPKKHTEISISRARNAFPNHPSTVSVTTSQLPLSSSSVEVIFLVMAAHEIRDAKERIDFFKELKRILKNTGQVVVVEHLRDLPNFLAYSLGAFHFFSKQNWLNTFTKAGLHLKKEIKITPFVSLFILEDGNAP